LGHLPIPSLSENRRKHNKIVTRGSHDVEGIYEPNLLPDSRIELADRPAVAPDSLVQVPRESFTLDLINLRRNYRKFCPFTTRLNDLARAQIKDVSAPLGLAETTPELKVFRVVTIPHILFLA
jgi:hypothetical protein